MSRERIWITTDDGSRCGEVLGSAMMLGNNCKGSGTGTRQTGTGTPKHKFTRSQVVPIPLSPVPVPPSRKSPVAKWYRYHTYWYRYQQVIFAGFEHNSNSSARVRLFFDHQFEITKEKGIKAKENRKKEFFFILGFWFHRKSVFFLIVLLGFIQ